MAEKKTSNEDHKGDLLQNFRQRRHAISLPALEHITIVLFSLLSFRANYFIPTRGKKKWKKNILLMFRMLCLGFLLSLLVTKWKQQIKIRIKTRKKQQRQRPSQVRAGINENTHTKIICRRNHFVFYYIFCCCFMSSFMRRMNVACARPLAHKNSFRSIEHSIIAVAHVCGSRPRLARTQEFISFRMDFRSHLSFGDCTLAVL